MATVWLAGFDDAALRAELVRQGHTVDSCDIDRLLTTRSGAPDVAFVKSPESAPVLARKLSLQAPATAVVLVLASASPETVSSVLDCGAADVLLEPIQPASASALVVRLLRDQRTRARLGFLEEKAARGAQLDDVVTDSPKMKELLERIGRIARRSALGPPLSILLTGETGTGKGLFARVLHFSSRRRDGPFIEVNCAALPATLLEAELFGYERGAFTDAKSARVGLLEAAHGGTLFLDEVSHLSLEGQAKLLTALETRTARRLGGTAERTFDVQVIAASSHDVQKLVAQGQFRPELLHRLTALWFQLPPLRERGEDAVLLADRFLAKVAAAYGLSPKRLSEATRAAVRRHSWPGNVRELYHAIERAVLAEERDTVEPSDLALAGGPVGAAVSAAGGQVQVSLPAEGIELDAVEKATILEALRHEGGNVSRAAAYLRISRDTLRSRIEKHRIDVSRLE